MIKQSIKENILYLSISNEDFSYRIPVEKLGTPIDWKVGQKGTKGIVFENVSKWTLQLFTKKVTEGKYVKEFVAIIQEVALSMGPATNCGKKLTNAEKTIKSLVGSSFCL
mgnify:CR=1 FL=1